MSSAASSVPIRNSPQDGRRIVKMVVTAAILAVAAVFLAKYALRYYLSYNEAAFTDARRGAPNYWVMRGWLMAHITGGMVALLTGPFQFWTGFRTRYATLHRRMGQLYLAGVAVGSLCAFRLGFGTTLGWPAGAWLVALGIAWSTTAGMAYYTILRRQVQAHQEWMARAYVVTFAFVTFRLLNDYPPLSRLEPAEGRANMIGWACWSIPLLLTDVVLQIRRMPRKRTTA